MWTSVIFYHVTLVIMWSWSVLSGDSRTSLMQLFLGVLHKLKKTVKTNGKTGWHEQGSKLTSTLSWDTLWSIKLRWILMKVPPSTFSCIFWAIIQLAWHDLLWMGVPKSVWPPGRSPVLSAGRVHHLIMRWAVYHSEPQFFPSLLCFSMLFIYHSHWTYPGTRIFFRGFSRFFCIILPIPLILLVSIKWLGCAFDLCTYSHNKLGANDVNSTHVSVTRSESLSVTRGSFPIHLMSCKSLVVVLEWAKQTRWLPAAFAALWLCKVCA